MAYEFFESYKPKPETAALLKVLLDVVEDYKSQGYKLTLRQLYYQIIGKDLMPNTEQSYKKIGDIVSAARLGAYMDWDAIEDRVRVPKEPQEFENIDNLVEVALRAYRLPRLKGQEQYVELWVEKDALAGVLWPIANQYHVALQVNRGYSSTSAMKEAGSRIRSKCKEVDCNRAYVLYLGDMDPSGEDMVRDVGERLHKFVNGGTLIDYVNRTEDDKPSIESEEDRKKRLPPIRVHVEKLALTMEQVEEHEPPPNPAKVSDSRAAKYIEEHGDSSWEVDALPPSVLVEIITSRLDELIDAELVEEVVQQETADRERLKDALAWMKEQQE